MAALPDCDLFLCCRGIRIDLLVCRGDPSGLGFQLLNPGRKMLPFPLEVTDIRFLVPQPALDILEIPSLLLDLVGKHRDRRIIEPLFELFHPFRELGDLPGGV